MNISVLVETNTSLCENGLFFILTNKRIKEAVKNVQQINESKNSVFVILSDAFEADDRILESLYGGSVFRVSDEIFIGNLFQSFTVEGVQHVFFGSIDNTTLYEQHETVSKMKKNFETKVVYIKKSFPVKPMEKEFISFLEEVRETLKIENLNFF